MLATVDKNTFLAASSSFLSYYIVNITTEFAIGSEIIVIVIS